MQTEVDILFKGFSGQERSDFLVMGGARPFAANEVILAPGQSETHLSVIQGGTVAVWADRTRLTELRQGDTLGTSAMIEPNVSTVLARAETDGGLLMFSRQQVLDFFRVRPERLFFQFCANIFSIWVAILERRNRRIFELKSAILLPQRRGRPRVLIVDDEHPVRDALGDLLEDLCEVLKARDGEEAIRTAMAERPDIVLLNLRMPGVDGYQVCQRLKADLSTSHIPVIVVTAMAETADRVKGLLLGADDYLIKPVDMEDLRAKVQQTLKRFENIAKPREEFST